MDTWVVPSSPGGGKAGSQPKDLGGKAGASSGVWEHLSRAGGRTEYLGCGSTDPWA